VDSPEVHVGILGPVEIWGAAEPFRRSAARELVVYLACHRRGARSDVWSAALWMDRCVASSTVHSTVSVARRALGRTREGVDHLPRSGRVLRLAETVGSDVEQFAAAAASPHPHRWKEALGLIRGRLFDGLSLCDWAVLDGTAAQIESMVVETALQAAEHYLSIGAGEEAQWMIRRGLRISPYDERLYRALLRSTEGAGNRVGLRSAMSEILLIASDGDRGLRGAPPGTAGDPWSSIIHPKTIDLYWELTRGASPAARGHPSRL
jgi:DNA-binding SARP family transcriptional activator